jgi:hypothetical protein
MLHAAQRRLHVERCTLRGAALVACWGCKAHGARCIRQVVKLRAERNAAMQTREEVAEDARVQASEPMPRRLQLKLLDPGDRNRASGASGGHGPSLAQFRARSLRWLRPC